MFPLTFQHMRRLLIPLLFLGLFFPTVFAYLSSLPPFEASDEDAHFLYIHNLLETRHLPEITSREQVAGQSDPTQLWAIESHQPPLYYAIGALLVSWTERDDINQYLRSNDLIFVRGVTAENHNKWLHRPGSATGDTLTAITVLRLYSLLLGVGTLVFVHLTARLILGGRLYPLLATLLVASIPTFISLSLSINNDNLVIFLTTIGVYLCVRALTRQSLSGAHIAGFALVLSAAALTKLTGLALFVIVFAALAWGVRRGYWSRQRALNAAGIILVTAAALAGWWYVRNLSLYGDPLALSATRSIWGREYEIAATSGDPGAEMLRIGRSFYMMFGYLHNPVYGTDMSYVYFAAVVMIGLVGVIKLLASPFDRHPQPFPHSDRGREKAPLQRIGRVRALGKSLTEAISRAIDRLDNLAFSLERSMKLNTAAPSPRQEAAPTLPLQRDIVWLLLGVCGMAALILLVGTRSVDISYGRLLFPALAAFALLVVTGWRALLGEMSLLLIVPLVFVAITTPYRVIQPAYPQIMMADETALANLPRLDTSSGDLELAAVDAGGTVTYGERFTFDVYLRGNHPDNPFLTVTALDSLTLERLGHAEVYPGIAPTNALDPDRLYRASIPIRLDPAADEPARPRVILLDIGWQIPTQDAPLLLLDSAGNPLDRLIVPGPVLFDTRYEAPDPEQDYDPSVRFSHTGANDLALDGYTLSIAQVNPGDDLEVTLHWGGGIAAEDWTLTLQLHDMDGSLITQDDGPIPGLPTTRWLPDMPFAYTHTLTIPDDTPPGEYRLLVGWYNEALRMSISNTSDQQDNLLILPQSITVEEG